MARERFVNKAPWREKVGSAAGLATLAGVAWTQLAGNLGEGGFEIGDLDWLAAMSGLLGLAGVVAALQSQWVAVGDFTLTARAWPASFRVPLDSLVLAAWVRQATAKQAGKSRKANGEVWLAHEDDAGVLTLSKALPGAPGPFLDRLAEAAPHLRFLPPLPPPATEGRGFAIDKQSFPGRPLLFNTDSTAMLFYAPLVVAGAWFLASVHSWQLAVPIILLAAFLLWGVPTPTVYFAERGLSGAGWGGGKLIPWASIAAIALGRGRGMVGGLRVFVWSVPESGQGEPLPERVPYRMASFGVKDPTGLYEELAIATGLRVEGDVAYRA